MTGCCCSTRLVSRSQLHLLSSRRKELLERQNRTGSNTAMSEEVDETRPAEEQQEMEDKVISPEKAEEAKLKARFPNLGAKPGGSDFLRKRLQKGPKYFDSGDYNMAKAKMKNKQLPSAPTEKTEITGGHIPTPQDLPQRKTSIVASKLAG
ncbi:cAMP-regulated phosphoprotein 19-like [Sebastes umbrosus]|uniref:cAMP-regulated phosphoprotein 19-like n=1 Tax=Sebastes umbrosus TaxID=72105 RepID=UPI00189FAADC|nr:cAMP-regulated phosphoprotein 19-like [Sebastes umbrosus]